MFVILFYSISSPSLG